MMRTHPPAPGTEVLTDMEPMSIMTIIKLRLVVAWPGLAWPYFSLTDCAFIISLPISLTFFFTHEMSEI